MIEIELPDEGVGHIDTTGKASEDKLGDLHGVLAEYLTLKLRTGKASPAELGVAVTFLKNNSITADPSVNEAIGKMKAALANRTKTGGLRPGAMREADEAMQGIFDMTSMQ